MNKIIRREFRAGNRGDGRMKPYDYLIAGGGLFGGVFAQQAVAHGKRCLVVERRDALGGNIRCQEIAGIQVHQYGAHIFHTSNEAVWEYVNRFVSFNRFTNSPLANYHGELYNMPFNMNTFHAMWGVVTPQQAKERIESQRAQVSGEPQNLEEQAIRLVGRDLYEKLVKGYTEKQWGRSCRELPAFIIRRLPVRYTYDNNYFDDPHQGIPQEGYNQLIERLFEGCEVRLGTDFLAERDSLAALAERVVYTGTIDSYFDYRFGPLEYRSIRLETEVLDTDNFQGVAVVNYTDRETPFTRIIEHKHFAFGTQPGTVISREYPAEWKPGMEPYYPVNDAKNQELYRRYAELAAGEERVIFGGRLAEYRYYNMDQAIASALEAAKREFGSLR